MKTVEAYTNTHGQIFEDYYVDNAQTEDIIADMMSSSLHWDYAYIDGEIIAYRDGSWNYIED